MKKGFTLIELLGVIIILGIISTIIYVTVDGSIKNSRQKACLAQEKNVIEAAKAWQIDHPNDTRVLISTLKEQGYIENLTNPMTKKPYKNNTFVDLNNYMVMYDNEDTNCENNRR